MHTRLSGTAQPVTSWAGDRRPDLASPPVVLSSDPRSEPIAVVLGGLGLVVLLALVWRDGWLLLLDWAPGPGGAGETALSLPTGPVVVALHAAVHVLDPRSAGWAMVVLPMAVTYAGGIRLARCWQDRSGRPMSWLAAGVAGIVAVTNPFVVARVYSGQIGMLWGCAFLWFYVASLVRLLDREDDLPAVRAGLWLALATACSLQLLVIGLMPLVAFAVVQRRSVGATAALRRALLVAATAGLVTALWFIPVFAHQRSRLGGSGGVDAAALFVDHGSITTLWWRALGGAGFWRPLPEGMTVPFGLVVACGWVGFLASWRHGRGKSRGLRHLLVGSAVLSLPLAYLGRGWLLEPWGWMVEHFAPAGLLREPGKALILVVMAPAVGAGAAVQAVRDQIRRNSARQATGFAAAVFALVLGVCLLSWAAVGEVLRPSSFPAAWEAARAEVRGDGCSVAVLGDGAYTQTGFSGARVVTHPAAGFLGDQAMISTDAGVPGIQAGRPHGPAERWLSMVEAAARAQLDHPALAPRSAARAGVGWIFLDRPVDRPGLVAVLASAGFEVEVLGDQGGLWRVPGGCEEVP